MQIALAATSQSIEIRITDDSGLPVTGLVAATLPTITYSKAGANADVTITPVDLATMATAWTSSGVKERGQGVYRLDLPNAALSTQTRLTIRGEASGKRLIVPTIDVGMFATAAAVAAALSANTLRVDSPFAAGGTLTVYSGDDYLAANLNSLTATISARTDLVGLVPKLFLQSKVVLSAIAPAVVSGTETITFGDLTAVQTATLGDGVGAAPARGKYQIKFLTGAGSVQTEIDGVLYVHHGLTV